MLLMCFTSQIRCVQANGRWQYTSCAYSSNWLLKLTSQAIAVALSCSSRIKRGDEILQAQKSKMKGTIIMSFMAISSLNVFGKNSVTPKIDPCIHVTMIEKIPMPWMLICPLYEKPTVWLLGILYILCIYISLLCLISVGTIMLEVKKDKAEKKTANYWFELTAVIEMNLFHFVKNLIPVPPVN